MVIFKTIFYRYVGKNHGFFKRYCPGHSDIECFLGKKFLKYQIRDGFLRKDMKKMLFKRFPGHNVILNKIFCGTSLIFQDFFQGLRRFL